MDQHIYETEILNPRAYQGRTALRPHSRHKAIQLRTSWQNEVQIMAQRRKEYAESREAFLKIVEKAGQSTESLSANLQKFRALGDELRRDNMALNEQESKTIAIEAQMTKHDYRLLEKSKRRENKSLELHDLKGISSSTIASVEDTNLVTEVSSNKDIPESLDKLFGIIREIKTTQEILEEELPDETLDYSRQDFESHLRNHPKRDFVADRQDLQQKLDNLEQQRVLQEQLCINEGHSIDPNAWSRDNESISSQGLDPRQRTRDWLEHLEPLEHPEPLSSPSPPPFERLPLPGRLPRVLDEASTPKLAQGSNRTDTNSAESVSNETQRRQRHGLVSIANPGSVR